MTKYIFSRVCILIQSKKSDDYLESVCSLVEKVYINRLHKI